MFGLFFFLFDLINLFDIPIKKILLLRSLIILVYFNQNLGHGFDLVMVLLLLVNETLNLPMSSDNMSISIVVFKLWITLFTILYRVWRSSWRVVFSELLLSLLNLLPQLLRLLGISPSTTKNFELSIAFALLKVLE